MNDCFLLRCINALSIFLSFIGIHAYTEKPFVVVVPSFNNKSCFAKNLDSILGQNYTNFRVIYIDDGSDDGMSSSVEWFIQESQLAHKVQYQRNAIRQGALANITRAVHTCEPHEIVVLVDGDDWLAHPHVLEKLNSIYQSDDVWMTYGQYARSSGPGYACSALPDWVISKNSFRAYPWVTSHLRTFYAGLFHKIDLKDLQDQNGFFAMAWDLAMMFPMLEMAGLHSRFIPEVLYIYNTENPLNDFKCNLKLQQSIDRFIRGKKRYHAISRL